MKKSIPKVWERESEASILGNDREREFRLTPGALSEVEWILENGEFSSSRKLWHKLAINCGQWTVFEVTIPVFH